MEKRWIVIYELYDYDVEVYFKMFESEKEVLGLVGDIASNLYYGERKIKEIVMIDENGSSERYKVTFDEDSMRFVLKVIE